MFEYDRVVLDELLNADTGFRRLFDKHHALSERVDLAQSGVITLDDYSVENLKKQKLALKDRMQALIHRYRSDKQLSA